MPAARILNNSRPRVVARERILHVLNTSITTYMPYFCSCTDKDGNTLTTTVLSRPKAGTDNCLELQQVQFRIYDAAPHMSVLDWAQTFTLTPDVPVTLCVDGAEHTHTGPWTGITETLMEVTTVKPYGDVSTTIHKDGGIGFDRIDVEGRCDGMCPLTFNTVSHWATAVQPSKATT